MTAIIEELLLLARAESQSIALSLHKTQASLFVHRLEQSVRKIYQEKSITIKSSIKNIDEFFCSQNYLLIALKNILLNAAKHSSKSSTVTLTCSKEQASKLIKFTITDTGEGISSTDIPNIFVPFYRVDTARNRSNGGYGLGLSLSLALVKLHSGKINVSSREKKGSCFEIYIPEIQSV